MSQFLGQTPRENGRGISDDHRLETRWWNRLLVAAMILFGVFHLSRLSPIHGWTDDGTVYLRYAQNILEGRPYHQVDYGKTAATEAPIPRYPLGLSLILAPLVLWRGLDFAAFKVLMLILLLLSAAMGAWSLRSLTGPVIAFGSAVWVAGAYTLWRQADHINSDFLFLLIVSAYFVVVERMESQNPRRPLWTTAVVHALFIAAATSTRTIGFTLIPALLLYDLWRNRRFTREAGVTALLATLVVAAIGARSGGGYVGHFSNLISRGTLRTNLIQYPLAMGDVFDQGVLVAGVLDILVLMGALIVVRRTPHRWAAFAIPYGGTLLLWPYSDPIRFLIPLLPWLFACILESVSSLARWLPRPSLWVPLTIIALLLSQAPRYWASRGADQEGLNSATAMETYAFINTHLTREEAVACRKPRTVALLAGRKTIAYALIPVEKMGPDLCGAGVTHLLTAPTIFPDDANYLEPFIHRNLGQLDLLFRNGQFTLYRLRSEACGAWSGHRKPE